MTWKIWLVPMLFTVTVALADEPPAAKDAPQPEGAAATAPQPEGAAAAPPKPESGDKRISGMSILGNQEAPKSLVIVPWKSSELGESVGISTELDDSIQPVDREVFLRALRYYEIRSEQTP